MLPPERLQIVAFEKGPHTSYSACGLPYLAGGIVEDEAHLVVRSPQEFEDKYQIDARTGHEVRAIDPDSRRVVVLDLATGREFDEPFDELLIATGTEPLRPPIEGIHGEGIFGLGNLQSGIELRRALDERKPERAVVVGGGYIGLEMAEALVGRGIQTTVVEAEPQPMSTLDEDMGALVAHALRKIGVEVLLNEAVLGFESKDGWVAAVVTVNRTIPADVVVLGLGTRPRVELARASGIEIGESGAIRVDDHLRSSHEGVWAAGDCAEQIHRVTKQPVNFHLGTIANKMGRAAGTNIGGGEAAFPGVLGTAITKVGDREIARTGLSSREATTSGLDFVAASIRSRTKASYYPGSQKVAVKVLAERPSGRLLGAQIVGGESSGKRIDVLATALWNEMTVQDMMNMDLSYVPPLATVWDPVLIAARKAREQLEQLGSLG